MIWVKAWIKRVNNQKNIILAVFFAIWGWVKEDWKWGLAVFIMAIIAFIVTDKLKAPLGEGPLDGILGIRKR